jgi:hypothetical protein
VRTNGLALVVVLVLAGSSIHSAGAAHVSSLVGEKRPAAGTQSRTVVTPNWSGYVASSPTRSQRYFTSVTATWTVPTAHCRRAKRASSSAVWVGLGGYHTAAQEEVGTNSNCSASGKASYSAWFELVPYLSYRAFPEITDKVLPGDEITGVVRVISQTLVELRLQNRTRGWTFMRRITYTSPDTSTAEWVVEAPAVCVYYLCHRADLTNFDKVTIRGISATTRSATGNLGNAHWKVLHVRLVPAKVTVPTLLPGPTVDKSKVPIRKGIALSPAGATPGGISRDGRSFTVKWVPVANRNV